MKDEENLTAEEIVQEAVSAIDGPDFHGCGREFKRELKWVLTLLRWFLGEKNEENRLPVVEPGDAMFGFDISSRLLRAFLSP